VQLDDVHVLVAVDETSTEDLPLQVSGTAQTIHISPKGMFMIYRSLRHLLADITALLSLSVRTFG
jgi:hypothetical protein